LEGKGLRSKQDLEFLENDMVKSETEVVRAEKSLEIARRDLKLGGLGETQAELEVERAMANVDQAKANLAVADRDVTNATLNLSRITNDTAAAISRVGADIQSARESLAKNGGEIQKVENELANLRLRTDQQVVRAPTAGRIARLTTVGGGTIVKSGDVLATIVPTTAARAVELFVTDNDVPWVQVGRPVRLQFAGWPAVQITGMPGAAMGTFGGRISVIDPVDDGTARYRVVITPEQHTLPTGRKDTLWPSSELLRPGAESYGWIMLDTVPLGFELWRQFNGFPPNASKDRLTQKKGTKDPALGPIKLKSK
jgi:biotin carboxyl carrier protein